MLNNIHKITRFLMIAAGICCFSFDSTANVLPSYYCGLEDLSWSKVRRLHEPVYPFPKSVQIPLALPYKHDMAFMSPGFLICQAPIFSGSEAQIRAQAQKSKIRKLNFLLGNPAFLPEPRRCVFTRTKDGVAAYRQDFLLRDVLYSLEACVPPSDSDGEILIRFTVKNENQLVEFPATIGVHIGYPYEFAVANNNTDYNIFSVDAERMPMDDSVAYADNSFYLDGKKIAEIFQSGWNVNYRKTLDEDVQSYLKEPMSRWHHQFYRTMPQFRVKNARNVLQLSTSLKPGESRSFDMAMSINGVVSQKPDYEGAYGACEKFYSSLKLAEADFGNPKLNAVWKNLQITNMLMVRDKGDGFLHACQGHSNRHVVWTCEAADMMRGFTELGIFEPVKPIADLVFSWQDNGNPPEGKFVSTKGAIGATGPAWVSSTGAALLLACEYISRSNDMEFFKKNKHKLVGAAKWILGEVEETRKNPKLPNSGLMPVGRATDEDIGCSFPVNTVSYAGVKALLNLKPMKSEPDYSAMEKSLKQYQDDIERLMKKNLAADNSIEPILKACGGYCFPKFYRLNQTTILGYDAMRENTELIRNHVAALEKSMSGFSVTPMDRDVSYVNWGEYFMHEYYLKTAQYKKAWSAFNYVLQYGMSPDLHLTIERVSYVEPLFTPFQPNGSANGRILTMFKRNLFYDFVSDNGKRCVVILGGVSPFDFEDFGRFGFSNLPTSLGDTTLKVFGDRLELAWTNTEGADICFRLPKHFAFVPDSAELKQSASGDWIVPVSEKKLSGKITLK